MTKSERNPNDECPNSPARKQAVRVSRVVVFIREEGRGRLVPASSPDANEPASFIKDGEDLAWDPQATSFCAWWRMWNGLRGRDVPAPGTARVLSDFGFRISFGFSHSSFVLRGARVLRVERVFRSAGHSRSARSFTRRGASGTDCGDETSPPLAPRACIRVSDFFRV